MSIPFYNNDFLCSGDTGVTVAALVPVLCFPLHTLVAHRTYIASSYVILCSLLLAYIMFKNVLHLVAELKNRVFHIKVDISIFSGTDRSGDLRPTQPHGVTVGYEMGWGISSLLKSLPCPIISQLRRPRFSRSLSWRLCQGLLTVK